MSVAGLGTTAGTAASPLSREVEKWRPTVNKYCSQYKIGEYTDLALALMQAESGGCEPDPMQAGDPFLTAQVRLESRDADLHLQPFVYQRYLERR